MLVWLVNVIFFIVYLVLDIALWILPIYFILKLIIPTNKYVLLAGKYVEMGLAPVRAWLKRLLPGLFGTGFDFSPVALWLAIIVAKWLLQLVQRILI